VTGEPIAQAQGTIVSGPPAFQARLAVLAAGPGWERLPQRLDRTSTRRDGSYWFPDLPSGLYRLEVGVPRLGSRYGTAQTGSIRVWATRDPSGRIKLDPAGVTLSPTRIAGRVTNQIDNQPVAGATVRLRGDTRVMRTDADGRYLLAGLVQGTPTVEVSARTFVTATRATSLAAGQAQTVDVQLTPA